MRIGPEPEEHLPACHPEGTEPGLQSEGHPTEGNEGGALPAGHPGATQIEGHSDWVQEYLARCSRISRGEYHMEAVTDLGGMRHLGALASGLTSGARLPEGGHSLTY